MTTGTVDLTLPNSIAGIQLTDRVYMTVTISAHLKNDKVHTKLSAWVYKKIENSA